MGSAISVDFGGGQPGHVHLSLVTTFPPNILVCPHNIFDKSTPVGSAIDMGKYKLYNTIKVLISAISKDNSEGVPVTVYINEGKTE